MDINPNYYQSSYNYRSQTFEFFDAIYNYPPKFKIKWEAIRELPKKDSLLSYQTQLARPLYPSDKIINEFFYGLNEGNHMVENGEKNKSYLTTYIARNQTKQLSKKFYETKTKNIQNLLSTIPIYTILNGRGEIVMLNSTNVLSTPLFTGGFAGLDPFGTKAKQQGLFFFNQTDAETFLQEIVLNDPKGTKAFGLSVHCFGLDFAYRTIRETAPGVDFRFVPDLQELQLLITSSQFKNTLFTIVKEQTFLPLQSQVIKFLPIVNKYVNSVDPFALLAEKSGAFKGVPIYIIPNVANKETYIYFDSVSASNFLRKKNSRDFRLFSDKPKIYISNLEDFLEAYEEIFNDEEKLGFTNSIMQHIRGDLLMFPSRSASLDLDKNNLAQQASHFSFKPIVEFFIFKFHRFRSFIDFILNSNTY